MGWYKSENLIRQLFEAMGLEVHITQPSRDEGDLGRPPRRTP